MSLNEISLFQAVKQQYLYKFRAYSHLLLALLVTLFLSLIASTVFTAGYSHMRSDIMIITVKHISTDLILVCTIVWAFFASLLCASQNAKCTDFTYVSNSLSSSISSISFLLSAALVGALAYMLAGSMLRVLVYMMQGSAQIVPDYSLIHPENQKLAFVAGLLYISLSAACGFFTGTMIRINKLFLVVLPLLVVLVVRLGGGELMTSIFNENSLKLFAFRVICLIVLLFLTSTILFNRQEVRQ